MPTSAKFKIVHPDASTCPVPDPRIEGAASFVEVDEIARSRKEPPQASCPEWLHVVVPRKSGS